MTSGWRACPLTGRCRGAGAFSWRLRQLLYVYLMVGTARDRFVNVSASANEARAGMRLCEDGVGGGGGSLAVIWQ